MGWGMWVLMLVGMAGFWAVVLMGIRALFLAGGNTPAQGFRDFEAMVLADQGNGPRRAVGTEA